MNATKNDIIERVKRRARSRVTSADIRLIVDLFTEEILRTLSRGNTIEIRGFGIYNSKREERTTGRNPKTGERIPIPPRIRPLFRFTKDAKNLFNKLALAELAKKKHAKNKKLGILTFPYLEKKITMEIGTSEKRPGPEKEPLHIEPILAPITPDELLPVEEENLIIKPPIDDPFPKEPPKIPSLAEIVGNMAKNKEPGQGSLEYSQTNP